MRALIEHLRHTGQRGTYVGDCKAVVDAAIHGVPDAWTSWRNVNADLWREVKRQQEDHGTLTKAIKVKSHRGRGKVGDDDDLRRWQGNILADACAKELGKTLLEDQRDEANPECDDFEEILKRIAFTAAWSLKKRPQETTGRTPRPKKPPVVPGQGGHTIAARRLGGWECTLCKRLVLSKTGLRDLRSSTCSGAPGGRDGNGSIHGTHQMEVTRGVHWCRKCGAYTTRWPRVLRRSCRGAPNSEAQANVKRRLSAGLTPTTAHYLGEAEDMPRHAANEWTPPPPAAQNSCGKYMRLPGGPLAHTRPSTTQPPRDAAAAATKSGDEHTEAHGQRHEAPLGRSGVRQECQASPPEATAGDRSRRESRGQSDHEPRQQLDDALRDVHRDDEDADDHHRCHIIVGNNRHDQREYDPLPRGAEPHGCQQYQQRERGTLPEAAAGRSRDDEGAHDRQRQAVRPLPRGLVQASQGDPERAPHRVMHHDLHHPVHQHVRQLVHQHVQRDMTDDSAVKVYDDECTHGRPLRDDRHPLADGPHGHQSRPREAMKTFVENPMTQPRHRLRQKTKVADIQSASQVICALPIGETMGPVAHHQTAEEGETARLCGAGSESNSVTVQLEMSELTNCRTATSTTSARSCRTERGRTWISRLTHTRDFATCRCTACGKATRTCCRSCSHGLCLACAKVDADCMSSASHSAE